MDTDRLSAFSDGVLAIIITIMVLEFKIPHGHTLEALTPLLPAFFSYVLSFIYVGIYWNNHHHLVHAVRKVNGSILWANLHLLFWLSLMPFATGWMGENGFAGVPSALYGVVLLMAAIAYWILVQVIMAAEGPDSLLRKAIGHDWKGNLSPLIYLLGIGVTLWVPWVALVLYSVVAFMWLVPDRRIERVLAETVDVPHPRADAHPRPPGAGT